MSRPGVTYQDIAFAANELKGQGRSITIENIRAYLGTGSIGTINKYLRQWREAEASIGKIASKEKLPEDLVGLVKGLWEGILTRSEQQFTPIEENYQREVAELKAELEKYKHNNQRWQKLFNEWQREKTALADEKLTLEQALEFAHKENHSLNMKYDGLLQQLQEKQERVDELHQLHKQTQANLEHYRESAREQRLLEQQQFEREKQQWQLEVKNLNSQLIIQQNKYAELQQQNQLINQSFFELEKNHNQVLLSTEQLNDKVQQLEKANIELQLTNQYWQKKTNNIQGKLEGKTAELITIQSEIKILNQRLYDIKEELHSIQNQNKLLINEKWVLAQEKAQLDGQMKQMQKMITAS